MTSRIPGAHRRARLDAARLYLVSDAQPPGGLERLLDDALGGGVDVIQLREKDAPDRTVLDAARTFRRLADVHGALFVLNDRPDLALAAGADGVHVGQEDTPVKEVRDAGGEELLIGLSTHSPEQLAAGATSGADYLCVGPVWETPTKAGRPATGLGYVRHAAAQGLKRPWFAIGGIDRERIHEVAAAGAKRVVVVRAIRDAPDPGGAAGGLRAALERRPVGAPQ